ncbi:hypothetical protein ACE7GA_01100 [Roseomonas sp. CCTCC AB2023176]|uniref:hypothetical protein n=1 Tax=Roseomonas sp. CCTCC AB2023176 TaxID=3342640 RepID=UPI0035DBC878
MDRFGIPTDRLENRYKFLSARADIHRERGSMPGGSDTELACCATLLVNAGAIALLLDRVPDARARFADAGWIWLKLGLYYGAFLLRLAGRDMRSDRAGLTEDFSWILGSIDDAPETQDGSDVERRRYERSSAESPRQLLSLVQAGYVDADELFGSARLDQKLRTYRSVAVGPAGIPLGAYVELHEAIRLGALTALPGEGSRSRSRPIESLRRLIGRRAELLDAARDDSFHWRMALNPVELIDFDFVALGLTALEHDRDGFARLMVAVESIVADVSRELVLLPFEVAYSLRSDGMERRFTE